MREKLTFISLFAGIGGFDLGFERAGMECVWQVEIDDKCNDVLARHWPDVKRHEDVRDVGRENLGTVDVICGGFPCQDLSVAGRREGLAGERSGLWHEFIRVVEEIKPEWVVIENVPGLLSSYSGDDPPDDLQSGQEWETTEESDLAIIVRGLEKCGYWWTYRVLDAQFWGVAQRRRRVFIVGYFGDRRGLAETQSDQDTTRLDRLYTEVLFERDSSPWDSPPSREAGKGTAAAITERTRASGRQLEYQEDIAYALDNPGQGGRTQTRLIAYGGNNTGGPIDVAAARNAHGSNRYDFESETFVMGISENQRAEMRLTPYVRAIKCGGGKPGQGYPAVMIAPEISPALRSEGHDASEDGNGRRAFVASVRPTLQSDSYSPMKSSTGQQLDWCIGQDYGVRRLTPTECERLQGFPDGWTAGQSDSARYRQLGNAVAVPVAEWIGKRIINNSD